MSTSGSVTVGVVGSVRCAFGIGVAVADGGRNVTMGGNVVITTFGGSVMRMRPVWTGGNVWRIAMSVRRGCCVTRTSCGCMTRAALGCVVKAAGTIARTVPRTSVAMTYTIAVSFG